MDHRSVVGSKKLRADIQGMRAIAVALVLLFHFDGKIKGGYLGVDMFFVISGFVIAQSTIREIEETGTFDWKGFLRRRVRRLLPGAAVVLVATSVAALIFLSPFGPQQETARMVVGAATYSTNFLLMPRGYFAIKSGSNPLLHFWSLAVEEQFYFVWPFITLALLQLRRRLGRAFFQSLLTSLFVILIVASCLLYYLLLGKSESVEHFSVFNFLRERNISLQNFGFYSPLTRAWEFLAGVIGFLVVRKNIYIANSFWSGFTWVIGAVSTIFAVTSIASLVSDPTGIDTASHPLPTMLCVLGTTSMLVSGASFKLSHKILDNLVFGKIGDWSYSIYLWHWPIWAFTTRVWTANWILIIFIIAASTGFGAVQYQFFEDSVRKQKIWKKTPSLGLVASLTTGAVVVAACFSWLTPIIAMQIAGRTSGESALHIIEKQCPNEEISIGNARSCVYSNPEGEKTAVLVGDSMAKSLSDGFTSAAENLEMKSFVFSMPGCAFLREDSPVMRNETCSPWRENVFDAIRFLKPDVLVIANLSSLYLDILQQTNTPESSVDIWVQELSATINASSLQVKALLLVQPPPKFQKDVKYDISLLRPIGEPESTTEVIARRAKENAIEQTLVVRKEAHLKVLNFDDVFCAASTCSQVIEGQLMFEDGDHLTPQGSLLLVGRIEEAIRQIEP